MKSFLNAYYSWPSSPLLEHRQAGFALALRHLELAVANGGGRSIVETGCARAADNWRGDGLSTVVWDWARAEFDRRGRKVDVYSFDLDLAAVAVARRLAPGVKVEHGDSLVHLSQMAGSVALASCAVLYLDSLDWSGSDACKSAEHAMHELACVWASLPRGCLVMVDDCHNADQGKHVVIERFMKRLGIDPVYRDYQIAWVKPDFSGPAHEREA